MSGAESTFWLVWLAYCFVMWFVLVPSAASRYAGKLWRRWGQ